MNRPGKNRQQKKRPLYRKINLYRGRSYGMGLFSRTGVFIHTNRRSGVQRNSFVTAKLSANTANARSGSHHTGEY